MKVLFLSLFISLFCVNIYAQNTVAKFKYEDAEKAFYEEKYEDCISLLDEAEKLLGKTAPNILHLKILAQHQLFEQNPYKSYQALDALRTNCNDYLTNYDIAGLEEKYRDVYGVQNVIKDYPRTQAEFENKAKAITDEKNRRLAGIRSFIDSLSPMVLVEGGNFDMGGKTVLTDNSEPVHQVSVSSFIIGKLEVTQNLWQWVMESNPSKFHGCDDCPVESISWEDVQSFINKLNIMSERRYRLPTEAEWEYAALGGNKSLGYPKFSGSKKRNKVAWSIFSTVSCPQEVGKKEPNELGIFDMTGNVWEWVNDWYSKDYYSVSPKDNPQGPTSGIQHVRRGGGFKTGYNCDVISRLAGDLLAFYSKPSKKVMGSYTNTGENTIITGFRLAMDKE